MSDVFYLIDGVIEELKTLIPQNGLVETYEEEEVETPSKCDLGHINDSSIEEAIEELEEEILKSRKDRQRLAEMYEELERLKEEIEELSETDSDDGSEYESDNDSNKEAG